MEPIAYIISSHTSQEVTDAVPLSIYTHLDTFNISIPPLNWNIKINIQARKYIPKQTEKQPPGTQRAKILVIERHGSMEWESWSREEPHG